MRQLDDPLQPLHQLLEGSGEVGSGLHGVLAPRHRVLHSASATHIAQVEELGFVGRAQEGRADHQVDLCTVVSLLLLPWGLSDPLCRARAWHTKGWGDLARPYLQGGQQGGEVGQLLLERLLLLLVLAEQSRIRP